MVFVQESKALKEEILEGSIYNLGTQVETRNIGVSPTILRLFINRAKLE